MSNNYKPLSEKLKDTFNVTVKVPETSINNKQLSDKYIC